MEFFYFMRDMGRLVNWARDKISIFNRRKDGRREGQVGKVTPDGTFHVSPLGYMGMKNPKPGGSAKLLSRSGSDKETLKVPDRRQMAVGADDIAFHVPSPDRRRKKPNK